jgi:hypothetical protein
VELSREVEVGIEDFFLDGVDVEITLHFALNDAVFELPPDGRLIFGFG